MLHLYEGLDPASLAVVPFDVQSYFGCMSRRTRWPGAPVYLPRCIGAYVGADIVCAILASDMLSGGVQLLADIGTNGEMALAKDGKLLCCSTAAGPAFEGRGPVLRHARSAPGAVRAVWREGDRKSAIETVQDQPRQGRVRLGHPGRARGHARNRGDRRLGLPRGGFHAIGEQRRADRTSATCARSSWPSPPSARA